MNWVDLVIAVVILIFALEGLGKSFLSETLGLFSFIFAFIFSLKFYNSIAVLLQKFLPLPYSFTKALGFILLWYLIEVVLVIITKLGAFRFLNLKLPGSGILSMIPAALRGLIFVALILVLVSTFPVQPKIKKDVHASLIGSWILERTYTLETPLRNVFGDLANDTLTFLTIKPKTNEKVDLGFNTNNFTFNEGLEKRMVDLVNQERVKQGLNSLVVDVKLREVARIHSADMFRKGYFAHYDPKGLNVADRAAGLNVRFKVIGENLAYAPSLQLAHRGLMNSPGHRANILGEEYSKVGIGIADTEDFGLMFTQVFSD